MCMCSLGDSRIKTSFERNCYASNEVAKAVLDIDNTQCKGKISNVIIRLKQNVRLDSGAHQYNRNSVVLTQSCGQVEPKEHVENKLVELDLGKIKPKVHNDAHSVDSDIEELSKQMMHMAESIQPTTNGKCLQVTYELETLLEFEGTCCIDNPNCIMSLFLQPPIMEHMPAFHAPHGWKPQVHDVTKIQIPSVIYVQDDVPTPKHSHDGH